MMLIEAYNNDSQLESYEECVPLLYFYFATSGFKDRR